VVSRADLEREGAYSPMTLVELDGPAMRRSEVWPDAGCHGLPVLLAGGEVGILRAVLTAMMSHRGGKSGVAGRAGAGSASAAGRLGRVRRKAGRANEF
jgi:hypothetical protein